MKKELNFYSLSVKEQYVEYDMYTDLLVAADSMKQAREIAAKMDPIYLVNSRTTCEVFSAPEEPKVVFSSYLR